MLILETEGVTEERKKLVRRLIELRIRLEEIRDAQDESGSSSDGELKIVNGHHFILQGAGSFLGGLLNVGAPSSSSNEGCNRCGRMIWSWIHNWYRCRGMQIILVKRLYIKFRKTN